MRSYGAADNGETVRLGLGETLVLALSENPTTGFRWVISDLPDVVVVASDDFSAPPSPQPGAGGQHRWAFRAERVGEGVLRIDLRARSPRGGDPNVFTLAIEVAAS